MSPTTMLQPELRSRRFEPPVSYGIARIRPRRRPSRGALKRLGQQLIASSVVHSKEAHKVLRELNALVRKNLSRLDDDDGVRGELAGKREEFEFHFERAFHDVDIAGEVWTRIEYREHGYRDKVSDVELRKRRKTSNTLRQALLEHREKLWEALGAVETLGRLAEVPPNVDVDDPQAEMRRRYEVRIAQCEALGEEDQLKYWQGRLDDLVNFEDDADAPLPKEGEPAGDDHGDGQVEGEEELGGPQTTGGQTGAGRRRSSRRKRKRGKEADLASSKRARAPQGEATDGSDEAGMLPYKTLERLPWYKRRVRKTNARFPSGSDIPTLKMSQDQKVYPYSAVDIPNLAPALPDTDLYDEDDDADDHDHDHKRTHRHERLHGTSASRPRIGPEPLPQPTSRLGGPPAILSTPAPPPIQRPAKTVAGATTGPERRRRMPPKPSSKQRPRVSAGDLQGSMPQPPYVASLMPPGKGTTNTRPAVIGEQARAPPAMPRGPAAQTQGPGQDPSPRTLKEIHRVLAEENETRAEEQAREQPTTPPGPDAPTQGPEQNTSPGTLEAIRQLQAQDVAVINVTVIDEAAKIEFLARAQNEPVRDPILNTWIV